MEVKLRADEHATRAERHRRIGSLLAEAGDEWAAVPLFYSGYHLVKRALLIDPIFDQPTSLSKIDVDLTPNERFTSRHHGRKRGDREWGINELVLKLYRPAAQHYERLHQASILVRYGAGLPAGDEVLPSLDGHLRALWEMSDGGELTAPLLA